MLLCVASQMWNLVVYLPLMIGDKIDEEDEVWNCFLILLDIVKICTAKIVSPCLIDYLETLIEQHHVMFKQLYPHLTVTPKLHYMVHFAEQMRR